MFSSNLYACTPALAPRLNAEQSAFAMASRFPNVLDIGCTVNIAQIDDSVISTIPIDVIDLSTRHFTVEHQPSDSMCKIPMTVEGDASISDKIATSDYKISTITDGVSLSKTHPSIEMTCIRFVSDELSSTFGSRFHLEMISCLA